MTEKAWIVYDTRYQHDPDAAQVLELFAEQPKPSDRYLQNEYGGIGAVLVECDVKREDGRNMLVNHQVLGIIL